MMKRSSLCLIAVLAVAAAYGGCVTSQPLRSSPAGRPELEILEQLHFGRAIPSGGEVSDADWDTFLAEVVTPRFPSGFAVMHGEGQWREKSGAISRERSFFVELNHADNEVGDRVVTEITSEYKRRFKQEAVFRMRHHVDATY